MGKLHEKLLSFFLLLFISMPFYVSAFPTGAGTCNVEEMPTIGHGTTNLISPAGYMMNVTLQSQGKFQLSINGPGNGIEGLLVYVVDSTNTRLGQFSNLPDFIQIKPDCTGQSTVTHKSSDNKKFPINLNWDAPQGTSGNLIIKSLVVKDFSDWARLDDVTFDPISGTSTSTSTDSGAPVATDGFLQKYTLFIIMVGITTLLYVVGSVTEAMLKRQQVKSKSFAKTIQNGST